MFLCLVTSSTPVTKVTIMVRYYSYTNALEVFRRGHFLSCYIYIYKGKGKGKAIPLQAWTGPEGSRMLRLPDFNIIGT